MKTIYQNAAHIAATEQLTQLMEAHAAAVDLETALLGKLNAKPEGRQSALQRALATLAGDAPPARTDTVGLQIGLDACRESLAMLGQAITEQRQVMSGLVAAESATVNAARKGDHIKTVQRIKTALAGLRVALEAEQSIRTEIAAGGFACTLEPIERHTLNPADNQSEFGQFERDVNAYLVRCDIESKPTATVRVLVDCEAGRIGDVLSLAGVEAAGLVHIGRAELTTAKPSRARTLSERVGEVVFS